LRVIGHAIDHRARKNCISLLAIGILMAHFTFPREKNL
jgi:hypothetical protein